jgi:hypothetical protein
MSQVALVKMLQALDKLERAIDSATSSLRNADRHDDGLLNRISSYKEILRRQRELADQLGDASARSDWHEVSRLTNLIQGASLLVKVDAGFILSTLRKHGSTGTHA